VCCCCCCIVGAAIKEDHDAEKGSAK
jgi:hypothetical protein